MKIEKLWFENDNIFILTDTGHTIGNPLKWYPRLNQANANDRNNFEIGVNKDSVHWYKIGEDLSLESFFDFKRELVYANI